MNAQRSFDLNSKKPLGTSMDDVKVHTLTIVDDRGPSIDTSPGPTSVTGQTTAPLLPSKKAMRPIRGASAFLQLKLMMWKHMLSKRRDLTQIAASLVVPLSIFMMMWLFRRKPYQLNADPFFINIALLLQPLAQVASLVTEKQKGLKSLMTTCGLSPAIYNISWFLAEALTAICLSLILALFALSTEILHVNGGVSFCMVWILIFLYLCASAAMAFTLSSLFSKPSTAAPATFLIYLGLVFVFLILNFQMDKKNRAPGCTDLYPTVVTPQDIFGDGGDDDDHYGSYSYGFEPPSDCHELVRQYNSTTNSTICDRPGICMLTCGSCKNKDFSDVDGLSNHKQTLLCFVPTFALTFAVVGFEQGSPPVDFDVVLGMLCLDVLCYMLAGWYLSEVFPGESGTPRKPWFIFEPSYWKGTCTSCTDCFSGLECQLGKCCTWFWCCCCRLCGDKKPTTEELVELELHNQNDEDEVLADSARRDADEVPEEAVEAVQIKGLRKEFGSHVAVEGLNLSMYEGEIFALLGHNGAGKTTTVSMLTGLLERTDGDASIYGHSLSSGIDSIRQLLGVCPQHDVLFDYLTIGEHIDLFARLKGATLEEMEREREAMLFAFELKPREDFFPVGLSGGMKRKACVALALTGDTRLCILDEPTTGLDPGARRRLWDTLAMLKRGRTIMLSTHFMDEAEILGDRVGIMKDGKLACVGSPVELKQQFDIGYELLVRHSGSRLVGIPDLSADGGGIQVQNKNPMIQENKLSDAQRKANADQMSLKIASFVLNNVVGSTQVSHHPVPNELRFSLPISARASFGPFLGKLEDSKEELGVVNFGISMEQFEEVFLKVGNESTVVESANQANQAVSRRRSSGGGGDSISKTAAAAAAAADGGDEEEEEEEVGGRTESSLLPSDDFYRNVGENIRYVPTFYGQTKAIFIRRLELAMVALGLDWNLLGLIKPSRYNTGNADTKEINIQSGGFKFDRYPTWSDLMKLPQLLRGVQTWLLILIPLGAAIAAMYLRTQTKTFYFLLPRKGDSPSLEEAILPNILVAAMIAGGYLFVPGLLAELLVAEREAKVRNLLAIMGVHPGAYWVGHAFGDLALLAIPIIGTWICFPIFGLHSFVDAGLYGSGTGPGLFFLIHILFILELLSFTYCMSHAFSSTAFAMALLPAISLALLVLPILIMLLTAQFDSLLNDNTEDRLGLRELLAILMATWAALGPHGFFLASTIMLIFPHKFAHDHTADYLGLFSEDLTPIWGMCLVSLIKTCSFAYGAYFMDYKHLMPLPPPPDPFKDPTEEELNLLDSDVADEFRLVNQHRSLYNTSQKSGGDLQKEEDEGDDEEEETNVETGVVDEDIHAIEYHRLRKVYPNPGVKSGVTVAVKDSNFHVVQGECFGLLGPNGAGKSTTISMMTRHTPSTRGDVFVMGKSVRQDFTSAARCMGVVTQDNSLYGELDAVAHLSLFARVRGVPECDIPSLVHDSLSLMELHPHCRKPSKRLSGGMKRKLCTALSLIGNPAVVAMDEPSSGLDPSSRRNLWKVINETMKKRAVVLTTHLLDEAEALCGRIGIMTHGSMQCIGSALHLRKKFGKGYQVVLTTKEMGSSPARDEAFVKVNQFVNTLFKNKAELINRHSRMLTYRVPAEYIHISKAFTDLETHMEELNLDSYVICQPTLEQVFLGFTVEKDREHSHLTNATEASLASAFDDTDIRIANAAKSRCCLMERPQHKKNFYRSCLLCPVPVLALLFGYDSIDLWVSKFVEGSKSKVYNTPKSENTRKARCQGYDNELADLTTNRYQHSFTHYAVFNESLPIDVCNGLQVPFTMNPNWRITNFSISVGVSGDLDGKNGGGPFQEWWWDDDFQKNTWDEAAKIYLKGGMLDIDMANINYDDWTNTNAYGAYLGECAGCPNQFGDHGWTSSYKTENLKTCGGYNNTNLFTELEGRCQLDCEENPFYETCVPETYGRVTADGWWQGFHNSDRPHSYVAYPFSGKEPVNNFTVTIKVDEGVNIQSCKSGLRFKLNIGLGYECEGGVATCSTNTSLGYNYGVGGGQFSTSRDPAQCSNSKHYELDYVNPYVGVSIFVVLELAIWILCCTCIGACCGMCCTKTPEDDDSATSDFQSKKKTNWFGGWFGNSSSSRRVTTQSLPAAEEVPSLSEDRQVNL